MGGGEGADAAERVVQAGFTRPLTVRRYHSGLTSAGWHVAHNIFDFQGLNACFDWCRAPSHAATL